MDISNEQVQQTDEVNNAYQIKQSDIKDIISLMNNELNLEENLTLDTGFDECNKLSSDQTTPTNRNIGSSLSDAIELRTTPDKEIDKSNQHEFCVQDDCQAQLDSPNDNNDDLDDYYEQKNEEVNEDDEEIEPDYEEREELNESNDDADLDENEHLSENERNDLFEFLMKAHEYGANALDLSKRNLRKVPKQLMLLNNLQYIYLEGNFLTKLPQDFFIKFPYLKWLDLRNNFLEELPLAGLENNEFLQYLLLENNHLRVLPNELATLQNLTALSLANNPIEYPPLDVVTKGCKQVQEYLRENCCYKEEKANTKRYDEVNYDVWASDEENAEANKARSASKLSSHRSKSAILGYFNNYDDRLNSVTRNLLIALPMRPHDPKFYNSHLRERLNTAKINANRLSKSAGKLLNKRRPLPPAEIDIYKDEEYEKAVRSQKLNAYKEKKEKISSKLQKVHDKTELEKFKNEMKVEQRKLLGKRLVKGRDYIEPARQAPFDISEDHLIVMTKEEREYVDKKLEEERQRRLSPETLWRVEEERRLRDNELQEKIREYTYNLLNRGKTVNAKFDRIQAAKDIKELKRIHNELKGRCAEMQFNVRTVTGNLIYRETKKMNHRATVSNILKSHK